MKIMDLIAEKAISLHAPEYYEGDTINLHLIQGIGTEKEKLLNDTITLYWAETLKAYVSIPKREEEK